MESHLENKAALKKATSLAVTMNTAPGLLLASKLAEKRHFSYTVHNKRNIEDQ
jgi:hypothetical protein